MRKRFFLSMPVYIECIQKDKELIARFIDANAAKCFCQRTVFAKRPLIEGVLISDKELKAVLCIGHQKKFGAIVLADHMEKFKKTVVQFRLERHINHLRCYKIIFNSIIKHDIMSFNILRYN